MNQETMRPVRNAAIALLVVGSIFLAAQTVLAVKSWKLTDDKAGSPEITVSGKGEAFAVPDIATFSYTVTEEGKTVKEAQDKATPKTNAILAFLKGEGIVEKDIRTVGYDAQPKYDYSRKICPANSICPSSPTIVGYTVSQTIEIKVRDTAKAGDILSGVGSKGVSTVSGLNFTIDDEDKITAEAREQAIADAKAKAEVLAKDLGVKIVRIKTFQENSGGIPRFYDAKATLEVGNQSAVAPSPEIPMGENKVTSNVQITFEIR
ncbi:MAG: hypothetical protein K0S38_685 [Candidatus Paceibacter sp.]|jgi:uncharacterized protein YggE|nr:hypothetical protein [Candidatus Paceibacter sp.]